MKILSLARNPYTRLLINFAFAAYNCAIGFFAYSWWFITVGAYYAVLATTRFSVLQVKRKAGENYDIEVFARKITGILLTVLSVCIVGINILAAIKDRGTAFHEIVMITISVYTFGKITVAIFGMVKAKRFNSPVQKALRNISLAEATVAIYSMQRSMLVSFPGMEASHIQLLNIFTGTAVFFVVLFLGINLIGGKGVEMAKSKLVKGYKKIENGVVSGYKKVERGVVAGYTKIEDKFVDAYLTKDGETVEEAKARLKKDK